MAYQGIEQTRPITLRLAKAFLPRAHDLSRLCSGSRSCTCKCMTACEAASVVCMVCLTLSGRRTVRTRCQRRADRGPRSIRHCVLLLDTPRRTDGRRHLCSTAPCPMSHTPGREKTQRSAQMGASKSRDPAACVVAHCRLLMTTRDAVAMPVRSRGHRNSRPPCVSAHAARLFAAPTYKEARRRAIFSNAEFCMTDPTHRWRSLGSPRTHRRSDSKSLPWSEASGRCKKV